MARLSIAPSPVLSVPQSVIPKTGLGGGLYIKAPAAALPQDTAAVALVRKPSDDADDADDADAEAPTHRSKKMRIDKPLASTTLGAQKARLDTRVEKKKGDGYQVADVLESPIAGKGKGEFTVDDENLMQEMGISARLAEVTRVDDILNVQAKSLSSTMTMLTDGQNRLLSHGDGMSGDLRADMGALLHECGDTLREITTQAFVRWDLIDAIKERLELQPEKIRAEEFQAEEETFQAQVEAEEERLKKQEELKHLECEMCGEVNFENDFIRCKHGNNVGCYEHGGHVHCYGLKDCPHGDWSCKDCSGAAIWECVSGSLSPGMGKGAFRERAPAPAAPSLGFSQIYAGPSK